jgi:predicted dehydrogenase
MKQLLQDLQSGKTYVADVPVPSAGPGEILAQVTASAVSPGTERQLVDFSRQSLIDKARSRPDLLKQFWGKVRRDGILTAWDAAQNRLGQPMPLGYSCAGVVRGIGDGVEGFRIGDRVACAGAGRANHAEFVSVPVHLCAVIPDSVPAEAAAFTTLASIALHGLRTGQPQLGETVLVIGLGILGQLAAQLAKAAGCRVAAVDPDPARTALARRHGLEHCGSPEQAAALAQAASAGHGADIALITAATPSSEPLASAAAACRDRGRVVLIGDVGMSMPRTPYFRKELSFVVARSYGPGRYDPSYEEGGIDYPIGYVRWTENRNLAECLRLMAAGELAVSTLITSRFPIEDAVRAYSLISGPASERPLGILITYSDSPAPADGRRVDFPCSSAKASQGGIGLLGAGNFASGVLLPNFARLGAELRGIASANGRSAAACAQRFGCAFASSAEDEVVGDAQTAAVVIATRHGLHARQALAALAAGKHVFVEKPLCLAESELGEIQAALTRASGRILCVGFNRRFAPHTTQARDFLAGHQGPQSILIRVAAGPLPDAHWLLDPAQGGGRLVGEGCHFLDWANFMAGSAPSLVQAWPIGTKPGMQDWSVRLQYPDGSAAEILYSSCGDPAVGKERFEVLRGAASVVIDDFRKLTLSSEGHTRTMRYWLRPDKGHTALLSAFLQTVKKGEAPPIPWPDIRASMRTVFACRESLRTGRPVSL